MTHFRPSMIATMVASALTVGTISAVTAAPLGSINIDKANLPSLNQSRAAAGQAVVNKVTTSGMVNTFDAKLDRPTFVWQDASHSRPEMIMVAAEKRNEFAANHYLNVLTGMSANKKLGSSAKLRNIHDIKRGGIVAKYKQEVNGVEVFNREYNIMMDRDHNLVAGSGYFSKAHSGISPLSAKSGVSFGNPVSAISTAFADMGGDSSVIALSKTKTENNYTSFDVTNGTTDRPLIGEPRSKNVYFEFKGKLVPAQYVEVQLGSIDTSDSDYYSYVIEAQTQRVLFKMNLTAEHANYRVYADPEAPFAPWDGPHGNVNPADGPDQIDTNVIMDAPLVHLNNGPISTEDEWLPHDSTETIGNNVAAYVDVLPPDGLSFGDYTAEMTSDGTFDYKLRSDEREYSMNNRKASIVNLFYMNNYLHDEFYDHGFDEMSGNAQASNMERGGEEGDPLLAEAQDYSGTNNANMSTPADGASPRMQMFLWSKAQNGVHFGVNVTSHPELGLLENAGNAGFGQLDFDLSGDLVRIVDGTAPGWDGCEAATNADALAGKIAFIDRGACGFTVKVKNAQDAGAIAAVVANNRDGDDVLNMGGDDASITIPSMFVSQNVGASIQSLIDNGETVTVNLLGTADIPYKDSSWDNAIVSHEWGHYISNRLVGNASGLSNNQGRSMGEGWGDFHALLTVSSADESAIAGNDMFQKPYAAISYVRSFYNGIRLYPYTTDMSINLHTFDSITDNPAVHASGNVWATMLWDSFVGLINDERYTYAQAKSVMKDYLVAGYKMTPNAPTYTEARDAILAAAYANEPADYNIILAAFARRGMGLGAMSPDRESTDHTGVVESYVTEHSALQLTSHNLNLNYEGMTSGFCSSDYVLDKGETGTLSLTVHNRGSETYSNIQAKVEVVSEHDVTLPNDGMITIETLGVTGSATSVPVEFTLNESGTAEKLEFKVSFPDLAEETSEQMYMFSTVVNYDFVDVAPVANVTSSDAEDIAIENDFKENVMAGGEQAIGTGGLSMDFGDLWREIGVEMGDGSLFIKNNNYFSDIGYETKPIVVGLDGEFQVNWVHYYEFEDSFDGGVVEISINGEQWLDVTAAGQFLGDGYNGSLIAHSSQPLPDRAAFTGTGAAFEAVNFGTLLNGNTVRFRFRVGSDGGASEMGWIIDDFQFANVDTSVFSSVIAGDTNACDNRKPHVSIGDAQAVNENGAVTLSVEASDLNGDTLTYSWTQVSGPDVTLTGADTAMPTFAAPAVAAETVLEFMVTVSDGTADIMQHVMVTVADVPVVITVGEAQSVNEDGAVTLSVEVTDVNNSTLSYVWTQTSGPDVELTGADTMSPTFTAPSVTEETVLEFTVTVNDGFGSVMETVSVTVADVPVVVTPPPPVVNRSGGGGSTGFIALLLLPLMYVRRRFTK